MKYYYDLHLHSCLSPCGDRDSTPDSIAGMGELNGLELMALTDHNTCKNCPAFFTAARRHKIIPVAGMELTTAEDIHVVCLFETLEGAMAFDREVNARRVLVKNRPEIFGEQLIVDAQDKVLGQEEFLLINATEISLEQVPELCARYGGVAFPAHIDREANGILSVLGTFPRQPGFTAAEVYDATRRKEFSALSGLPETRLLSGSDAHYLWHIREREQQLELPAAGDEAAVRRALISYLRGST